MYSIAESVAFAAYLALSTVGFHLVLGRKQWARALAWVVTAEAILYFGTISVSVSALESTSDWSMHLSVVTGMVSAGFTAQALTIFPIWGPVIALRAAH